MGLSRTNRLCREYKKKLTNTNAMNRHKTTATNSTYPKGGASCSKDSFVVNQTLVFQIKFCGKSPALRVAAKRYVGLPIPEKYPKIYFEIIPIFGMFAKISCYE